MAAICALADRRPVLSARRGHSCDLGRSHQGRIGAPCHHRRHPCLPQLLPRERSLGDTRAPKWLNGTLSDNLLFVGSGEPTNHGLAGPSTTRSRHAALISSNDFRLASFPVCLPSI